MQAAQRPDRITLKSLVDQLKAGSYVVPDFQRDFEWDPSNINALMRSIFLDYFIGSLLLWEGTTDTFRQLSCEPLYAYDDDGDGKPSYIVLDGQQRLTAIYYAIVSPDAPPPNRKSRYFYFIKVDEFMQGNVDEAFRYDWTQFASTVANDRNTQFEKHLFPLRVIGMGGWELPNWMQGYKQYWQEKSRSLQNDGDALSADMAAIHCQQAGEFGDHIRNITEKYQVSYIELNQDLELPKICDIFTQINHNGLQLNTFHLMNAMLKPYGLQLKHMWRKAEQQFNFEIPKMSGNALQVMSILKQTYCSSNYIFRLLPGQTKHTRGANRIASKEVLIKNSEEFTCLWERALNALDSSLSLLINPRMYGATSYRFLPYPAILPVFAALQESVREHFIHCRSDADRKIWKWYWASIFTNRYSGSVESRCAQDFREVSAWIERGDDSTVPKAIDEFNDRITSLNLEGETNLNSAVFKAVFNLMFMQGASDWDFGGFSKNSSIHPHHIVPSNWKLQMEPNERSLLSSVLNQMPLTVQTSKEFVGDRMPNDYLRELLEERNDIDIRTILEKHCITKDAFDVLIKEPFTKDDFREFLSIRSRTIKKQIRNLLEEYWTTSSQLGLSGSQIRDMKRKLDGRVKGVECKLRDLIDTSFGGKIDVLPGFVRVRIESRIESKKSQNPLFARDFTKTLSSYLKESDFSDLEKTITCKRLWQFFEKPFKKKERSEVLLRLSAVRKLRNWISHSSEPDEVTLHDGEAGLLWIESILELDNDG